MSDRTPDPGAPTVRHSSRIELSRSAMKQNITFLRKLIGQQPVISMVVKANAYGHGFATAVGMAERCGIRHFSVASSQEAQEVLRVMDADSRVMVMGILYDEDLPWIVENGVEWYVFDLDRLRQAAQVARRAGRPARIHLEVETGGNRTGLDPAAVPEAVKIITSNRKHLDLAGVCTHLAGAESLANGFRINKQIEAFGKVRKRFEKTKSLNPLYHVASSAATIALPESRLDMVRVGTVAYGLWPSPDVHNLFLMKSRHRNGNPLKRVLSWKTDVMQIKHVGRDEFVGYGTSYQAPRDSVIAVMPVGYGNGLPRELSNRGHVLVRGRRAPVVGTVNMNMFFADVTNIPGVEVGDEVVLVGRQKKNEIGLRSFSEFTSALNTEFVSRLPASIPREVVR